MFVELYLESIQRHSLSVVLQSKELLLLFYFPAQFFLRWHISEILGCKELVVVVQYGVVCHIFIGVGTEQNADGGVVTIWTYKVIVHLDIHVHLSYILITQFVCLQVNEDKTTEVIVIEYKVYVIILFFCMDMFLSVHKSKALAQLHQERNEVVDDALLQIAFCLVCIVLEAQELCYHRVL